jgi:hypothetical protein
MTVYRFLIRASCPPPGESRTGESFSDLLDRDPALIQRAFAGSFGERDIRGGSFSFARRHAGSTSPVVVAFELGDGRVGPGGQRELVTAAREGQESQDAVLRGLIGQATEDAVWRSRDWLGERGETGKGPTENAVREWARSYMRIEKA